jgi:hypothetical protein
MKMYLIFPIFLLGFLMMPLASQAASGSGAINLNFNTSVRAEGMGGAGVGMAWGTNTNNWANPALLAFRPGVHYTSFESQLAEGLADDIHLTNKEMTLGYFGATFLFAKVFIPGNKLDMGEQQATDENGQLIGTFNSWMETQYYGLGLDAVQLLDHILGRHEGWLSPYFSVTGGFVNKEFTDNLFPDWEAQDFPNYGQGTGSSSDYGFLVRATPINMTKEDGFLGNGIFGLRLGGAYGNSILNETDEFIEHPGVDSSDPFPRMFVEGWSLYGEVTLAGDLKNDLNDTFLGILGDMINPLISLGKTKQWIEPGFIWDSNKEEYIYEHDTSGLFDEKNEGWELGIGNVYYIRRGNRTENYGGFSEFDGDTEGWGINLQAGRYGGFRYDEATVPQPYGQPDAERKSWSVWVDPLAIFSPNY